MEGITIKYLTKEKYCSKCGEVLDIDTNNQSYCRTCRAEYNNTYYSNKVSNRKFIYFIESQDRTLYIGSCKGKYRVIYHLKGLTHLKKEPKDWINLKATKIRYIDVTEIVEDDAERLYIEKLYIDMENPLLNNAEPSPDIEIETMEKLEDIVYNQYIEFEEIDIKKLPSTLDGQKAIEFNYKDLVLR